MKIILIYFFLFTFWAENSLGFSSLANVKGLSLPNLSFYFLILGWAFTIALKRKLLEWNSANTYIILFIFFVIVSIPYKILLDEIPYISLKQDIIRLKNWLEPFIIFFIMVNIIDDEKICKRTLLGLMILLLITALSAFLASYKIVDFGRVTESGRASGFGNTNDYAGYLVLFLPLVFTFVIFNKRYALRVISVVVLFVTFVALVFTGSRSGILSFLVSISFYLFILYKKSMVRPQTLLYMMIIVLIISLATIAAAPLKIRKLVLNRIDPTMSEDVTAYSSGRLRIWQKSLKLFAEKPVFGHGYHTIEDLMELKGGERKYAHNQFLNHLVEFGIIGCALYILIFLKIGQCMWHYQRSTPDLWEKKLFISYVAGLVGYTVSMQFGSLGISRYIFWFYTAVILRYGQLQEISKNNDNALPSIKKNTAV